jgi:hypothetical protein
MVQSLLDNAGELLIWGLAATLVMTTLLHGSHGLGWSRLSLAFLVGTMFTGRRSYANILGFVVYTLGGWLFAIIYAAFFLAIGHGNWWIGLLVGAAHAIVLLVVLLPLIAYAHPRMANEYDGPTRTRRLEPPGFIGLNYGYRTPLSVLIAQMAYGAVLGLCFQVNSFQA